MRKRRKMPELNAGSMADIAFLLLIFFLVVTTIAEDKGIPVILPEYYDGPPGPAPENNVLKILVNADDNLLVESKPTNINRMKDIVIDFVNNTGGDSNKPNSPDKAIISLQNDVNTSYEIYVQIYAHIHDAYTSMRNDMAQENFKTNYKDLAVADKNTVLKRYPMKLSEADPYKID
jgi:biopolymer transport protein ExbD